MSESNRKNQEKIQTGQTLNAMFAPQSVPSHGYYNNQTSREEQTQGLG